MKNYMFYFCVFIVSVSLVKTNSMYGMKPPMERLCPPFRLTNTTIRCSLAIAFTCAFAMSYLSGLASETLNHNSCDAQSEKGCRKSTVAFIASLLFGYASAQISVIPYEKNLSGIINFHRDHRNNFDFKILRGAILLSAMIGIMACNSLG